MDDAIKVCTGINSCAFRKELAECTYRSQPGVSLKARIAETLQDIGIPKHILGYRYAKEAIAAAIQDRDAINAITKILYPSLAKTFATTPSRVERAIRHAIEVAWGRGDIEVHHGYFGYTINSHKGKPTNAEFIAAIAESLAPHT